MVQLSLSAHEFIMDSAMILSSWKNFCCLPRVNTLERQMYFVHHVLDARWLRNPGESAPSGRAKLFSRVQAVLQHSKIVAAALFCCRSVIFAG
jgi:hypothetical protein